MRGKYKRDNEREIGTGGDTCTSGARDQEERRRHNHERERRPGCPGKAGTVKSQNIQEWEKRNSFKKERVVDNAPRE